MNQELVVEISGWLGVVFYVIAYFSLSINLLKSNGYLFHILNILGAVGLITDAAFHMDRPNLVVNVVWFVIGLIAISRRFVTSLRQKSGHAN